MSVRLWKKIHLRRCLQSYLKVMVIAGILFLSSQFSIAANEYNFYFYGDDKDGKPIVKKEKVEPQPEETTPGLSQGLSEDEKIKKLTDEVLKRVNQSPNQETPTPEIKMEAPSDSRPISFWSGPKNYLSMGYSHETYVPKSNFNHAKLNVPYFLMRTKFLPWVSLEGAIPLDAYQEKFHLFRVGLLKELAISSSFFLHLSAGALINDRSQADDFKVAQKMPPNIRIKELYENKIAGYLGAGLTWRLANHLDLTASLLGVPMHGYFNRYSSPWVHMQGDTLWTAGLTVVF